MADEKFSQFVSGSDQKAGDILVGLRAGVNTQFNANLASDITIAHKLFVSSDGSDSNTGLNLAAPLATLSHAETLASSGTTIIILDSITDTNILLKPNVYVIGMGYPTITCTSWSLDSSWGTTNESLVCQGVNYTVTNQIIWDCRAFSTSFIYNFLLQDCTLTCVGGFQFYGASSGSFRSACFLYFKNTVMGYFSPQTGVVQLCDLLLNYGLRCYANDSQFSAVYLNCDIDNAVTYFNTQAGCIIWGNGTDGLALSSALATHTGANVLADINGTMQNRPPKFFTLNGGASGNQLDLIQDPKSYRVPLAAGSGIVGTDYFMDVRSQADSIGFSDQNIVWAPTNFTPVPDPLQDGPYYLTTVLAGLDGKLATTPKGILVAPAIATDPFVSRVLTDGQLLIGNTGNPPTATTIGAGVGIFVSNAPGSITISGSAVSTATSGFMYGFNGANGPGAKQAQMTVGFEDSCASADNSFVIHGPSVAINLTLTINTTGINGLDTGSAINDMRYYWFVIADSTGINTIATIASVSLTPLLPTGYNQFRCIGSVKTKRASTDIVPFYYRGLTNIRTFVYMSAPNESSVLSAGNATALTKINMLSVTSTFLSQDGLYTYHFTPTIAGDQFSLTQHNNPNIITRISADNTQWGQVKYSTSIGGDVDYKVDQVTNALDLYVSEFTENL